MSFSKFEIGGYLGLQAVRLSQGLQVFLVTLVGQLFLAIQAVLEFLACPLHPQALCRLQPLVHREGQQVPLVLGVRLDLVHCLLNLRVEQIRWCLLEGQEGLEDRQDLEGPEGQGDLGLLDFQASLLDPRMMKRWVLLK